MIHLLKIHVNPSDIHFSTTVYLTQFNLIDVITPIASLRKPCPVESSPREKEYEKIQTSRTAWCHSEEMYVVQTIKDLKHMKLLFVISHYFCGWLKDFNDLATTNNVIVYYECWKWCIRCRIVHDLIEWKWNYLSKPHINEILANK